MKRLPVTKLNYSLLEKGIYVAKHGDGIEIASCDMDLARLSLSEPIVKEGLDKVEKVRAWIEDGLKILAQYSRNDLTRGIEKPLSVKLKFLSGHDHVIDLSDEDVLWGESLRCAIRVDVDVSGEIGDKFSEGMALLYALGLSHELRHISGADEKLALDDSITFYESLSLSDRDKLISVLSQPEIDAGNVFLRFLRDSAFKPRSEKDRLIAWVRNRHYLDLPYDERDIIKALEEESDISSLRMRIYKAINDTYVQSVDTENANRIAEMCRKRGMRIVTGRFSRALYIDALLMANAKLIETRYIKESISELENLVKSLSLNTRERQPNLPKLPKDFSRVGGELQAILNLTAEERVSLAQIQGVVLKFKKALREFETQYLQELDARHLSEPGAQDPQSIIEMYSGIRGELRDKVEQIVRVADKVEISALSAPNMEPVFLVFLQRIYPIDAIYMGVLNQLRDPFFSADEEIHKLIRGCGHLMYTTANLNGWLRKCDDWIEALPAYAEYEIIPKRTDGGSYIVSAFVWRAILEEMYRKHAEDWAINIEEVMALEHVALAREILIETHRLNDEVDKLVRNDNIGREEAIRRVIERSNLEAETAQVSARIESAYLEHCETVARYVETYGTSRMSALRKLIKGSALDTKRDISPQCLRYYMELSTKRRRDLPSVHVLTTLGPGETENVENWLEESMALFNVSRAYGLESTKVSERVQGYEDRIYHLGEKILEELNLEGDLYNIMQSEGLKSRKVAVLKLIDSYPEVAKRVSELAVLKEYEEKQASRPFDPQDTCEPLIVENLISTHVNSPALPSADDEKEAQVLERSLARQKAISSLGLGENVKNYLRDHLPGRLGFVTARREVIAETGLSKELENPRFRYESHGPMKKYNILYTPSRVDLGVEEVESVKNVPKWIGGRDRQSANAGRSLYSLYNLAGPTAMPVTKFAEFLKVGENFFSRGGVFYLSLAAGANIDALGIGDFEFFRDQWNMRNDRIVLPTGETYGGFCVPKEFTLLYAIILSALDPKTSKDVLNAFGVPEPAHADFMSELREVLRMRKSFKSVLDWEAKAAEFFADKGLISSYLPRLPRLAQTLESKGLIASEDEEDMVMGYSVANWINKKANGLEEINRLGPFRKVHLIYRLIKESRRKNPSIAPDNKLIGVMSAPYKEGGRKDGREIPISDVRFSAGARKLEIYAGTAEENLLKHIDPEGRELVKEMLSDFNPPADIRIVGTCAAEDILNHVPGSRLEEIASLVNEKLRAKGLSQGIIDANCKIYGADLEQWVDIKEMQPLERKALIDEIGGRIHLLVLLRRGVFKRYEEAVQGVDFIDLGIPDPELLDLVDNLPKLLYLMRKGRPNSALVFADGTSGARRRTFSFRYANSKRKVKELFALDDNAVYGALGLGRDTVESWQAEMIRERQYAQELFDSLMSGDYVAAESIFDNIVEYVRQEGKAEEAAQEEIDAKKFKVPTEEYRYVSDRLGAIKRGLPLEELDFGTWLVLGGRYILNGKVSMKELEEKESQFETAMQRMRNSKLGVPCGSRANPFDPSFLGEPAKYPASLVLPKYEPLIEAETYREVETGISGSLKAVEEKAGRLQRWEERRKSALRAAGLSRRKSALQRCMEEISTKELTLSDIYKSALLNLGDGRSAISVEEFGRFLAYAKAFMLKLGKDSLPVNDIDAVFSGEEISESAYMKLAEDLAQLAVQANGDRDSLERIAIAMELLDEAMIVDRTYDVESPEEMTIAIARFFDMTLNNHIFDYIPYHYHKQRGAGFECLNREEKLELAVRRHRWLYTYIRNLIAERTELKSAEHKDVWIGDFDSGVIPVGVNVENETERFWFSYARLRDAIVLQHEGYPFPESFDEVSPDTLRCKDRTNVVIVYPHGNTTVPVALEQGARLSEEGINLLLCAHPSIEYDERYGRKVLRVPDGLMYVSADDYKSLLIASGASIQSAEERCKKLDKRGAFILVRFSEPIVAHGIFFHFTHPLRPYIGNIGTPIIQPLVWEAATHLKCSLPDMLKGSGVRTADQINWYQHQTAGVSPDKAKEQIKQALRQFADRHEKIIVKPEKESGGRMSKILPVREGDRILEDNIAELAELIYTISKVDNVAIQDVLPSYVRRLYTREFLEDMVDRFARIGVPVILDREPQTPLYSYFRQIVVLGKDGYEITHHITVISTRGVANVGQGGILYEYRDEIINPKYREDLRREITKATFNSIESQRKYTREHWREILETYLQIHPEFAGKVKMEVGADLTGFSDTDIPYEMGDYMPVFLVDEDDNLVRIFDRQSEELVPLFNKDGSPTDVGVYDEDGNPIPRVDENGSPVPIPMFDENGDRIPRFDREGNPISTLVMFKIEPNPGAGLWRPHNDQLPEERKGEGVFKIFKCLGERARIYKDKLNQSCPITGADLP